MKSYIEQIYSEGFATTFYLKPVNYEILENYSLVEKTYKVSNESMITYHGIKYSVPIIYTLLVLSFAIYVLYKKLF